MNLLRCSMWLNFRTFFSIWLKLFVPVASSVTYNKIRQNFYNSVHMCINFMRTVCCMMCVYCIQCIVYCTYTAVNILYTGTVNYHRFAFNVLGVLIIKVHCTQCTVHRAHTNILVCIHSAYGVVHIRWFVQCFQSDRTLYNIPKWRSVCWELYNVEYVM